jgi:hypothetical protein
MEERSILQTVKRRKANWIGHMLRRNCLLKHVIEGKIEGRTEVTGRRGRRLSSYCMTLKKGELKEEALGGAVWGNYFGKSYRPVARQST